MQAVQYEQQALCCCINSWQQSTNRACLQNVMYEMYPRVDEMKCDKSKLSNTLMGQSQSSSDSRKLLQADSNGPQLGFVSTLPCFPLSCSNALYRWSKLTHAHWQLLVVLMCLLLCLGTCTHCWQAHPVSCCIHVSITDMHPLCTVCNVHTFGVLLKQSIQSYKLYLALLA